MAKQSLETKAQGEQWEFPFDIGKVDRVGNTATGLQLIYGGRKEHKGVRLNFYNNNETSYGFGVDLISSSDVVKGGEFSLGRVSNEFHGSGISGISWNKDKLVGENYGVANLSSSVEGAQNNLISLADSVKGKQNGLILAYTNQLEGVQKGLVCAAKEGNYVQYGLVCVQDWGKTQGWKKWVPYFGDWSIGVGISRDYVAEKPVKKPVRKKVAPVKNAEPSTFPSSQ